MEAERYTERRDLNFMPWHIKADPEGQLTKDCILVAVMQGNEIQTISLHVADPQD